MKKFLVLLAVLGFMAAACSHAVKQSPQQAVQAAPAPKAAPAAPAAPALKPAPTTPVSESAQAQTAAIAKAEEVGNIHFAFDKYDLNKDAKATLKKLSAVLMKDSNLKVLIEGRCDERGTEEYNLALGDKRATQAKKYLVALGVDAGRISTVSYGKDKPLCTEHTEKCWAINRSDHFAFK